VGCILLLVVSSAKYTSSLSRKQLLLFVSNETGVPLKSFTQGIYNGLDHCCSSTVEQDIGC